VNVGVAVTGTATALALAPVPASVPAPVPASVAEPALVSTGTGPVVTDTSSNRNPFVAVFGCGSPLALMSKESTVRLTWSAGVGLLSLSSL
jgi:hypothetical protein